MVCLVLWPFYLLPANYRAPFLAECSKDVIIIFRTKYEMQSPALWFR